MARNKKADLAPPKATVSASKPRKTKPKAAAPKRSPGRPTTFTAEHLDVLQRFAGENLGQTKLARLMGVPVRTMQGWAETNADFRAALEEALDPTPLWGRETKYRPEFCLQVLQLGREGKSRVQIAAALDVSIASLQRWEDVYPEFRVATTRARDLSQAWFEDRAQEGIHLGPAFNDRLWSLQVRNRFPDAFKDKSELALGAAGGTGGTGGKGTFTVVISQDDANL